MYKTQSTVFDKNDARVLQFILFKQQMPGTCYFQVKHTNL
jgi:hypothetical protein